MWAGHALSWFLFFFFFCLQTLACITSNFAHVSFNVLCNIFLFYCWTVCWYVCMFTFDCLCDFRRWWPFLFWAFEYPLSRRLPCFGLLCLQVWWKGWKYGWYWTFFQKWPFWFGFVVKQSSVKWSLHNLLDALGTQLSGLTTRIHFFLNSLSRFGNFW